MERDEADEKKKTKAAAAAALKEGRFLKQRIIGTERPRVLPLHRILGQSEPRSRAPARAMVHSLITRDSVEKSGE